MQWTEGLTHWQSRVEDFYHERKDLHALCEQLRQQAADIMGQPVWLYKEKIVRKRAHNGSGFTPHCDGHSCAMYAPVPCNPEDFITACVLLTSQQSMECGPLELARGQGHGFPKDAYRQNGVVSEQYHGQLHYEPFFGEPGDVTFYRGDVIHRSQNNKSPMPRESMYFIFCTKGDLRDQYFKNLRAQNKDWIPWTP